MHLGSTPRLTDPVSLTVPCKDAGLAGRRPTAMHTTSRSIEGSSLVSPHKGSLLPPPTSAFVLPAAANAWLQRLLLVLADGRCCVVGMVCGVGRSPPSVFLGTPSLLLSRRKQRRLVVLRLAGKLAFWWRFLVCEETLSPEEVSVLCTLVAGIRHRHGVRLTLGHYGGP